MVSLLIPLNPFPLSLPLSPSLSSTSTSSTSPTTSPPKPTSKMTCPFAKYASKSSLSSNHHHHHHHESSSISPTHQLKSNKATLSEMLKQGTSEAHRAVESSPGVRAVLAIGGPDANGWRMARLDYIRWQVSLACIYAAMELPILKHQIRYLQPTSNDSRYSAPSSSSSSSLSSVSTGDSTDSDDSSSILQALLSSSISTNSKTIPILQALSRIKHLFKDIETHIRMLQEETGLEIQDFIRARKDEDDGTLTLEQEALSAKLKLQIEIIVNDLKRWDLSQEMRRFLDLGNSSLQLQDLVELLSMEQILSTSNYVERLVGIASNDDDESQAQLLSHLYVRYLGDLSGGQHILKRVRQRWPISYDSQDESPPLDNPPSDFVGFEFYQFGSSASCHELKRSFKHSLDLGYDLFSSSTLTKSQVRDCLLKEASVSFDLNRGLFDSLIPSEFKTQEPQHIESQDATSKSRNSHLVKKKQGLLPCPMTLLNFLGITIPRKHLEGKDSNQIIEIQTTKPRQSFDGNLLISLLVLFFSLFLLFKNFDLTTFYESDSMNTSEAVANSSFVAL